MKNLIILGVPRAGKSTLATVVAKKLSTTGLPLSLINADAVMGGLTAERSGGKFYKYIMRPLRHIVPGGRMRSKRQLRKKFCDFIVRFLSETAQTSLVVFEGAYISPERAVKMFDTNRFKIVVIGYPNISVHDKCADIRKFDKRSPINSLNEADMMARVSGLIKASQDYYKFCKKHNIEFVDTSYDYHGAIQHFADRVIAFLDDSNSTSAQ